MAIAEAIASVSAAIEVAKGLRSIERNFDAANYKLQLADLMTALSDARLELVAARDAATEQEAEITRLKHAISKQAALVEGRGGFKYAMDGEGKPAGLPICPTCEQRDGRITFTVSDGNPRKVRCPVCAARFEGVAIYARTPVDEPFTLEQEQSERYSAAMERLGRSLG